MPAKSYTTSLQRKSLRCEDTGVFRFDRPFGFDAKPGQWLRLTLDTAEGPQTKTFSDAAAPDELEIDITTRLTGSAFKDALKAMDPGDHVTIAGPGGRLRAPAGAKRVALLMGGVGIAPGRGIIRDQVRRADGSTKLCLFYGSNTDSCVLFGNEFEDYAARLPWFKLVSVVATPTPAWTGESGFITSDTVLRHIEPDDGWHFLVAGPPSMIGSMRAVLTELGIGEDRATFEEFTGY
jgi:ferredoxin-NADP reductase